MAVKYGKGDKKKAIQLQSLVVRTRAGFKCERCGIGRGEERYNEKTKKTTKVAIQCGHIISRQLKATVSDENNGFSLCGKCHWYLDHWHVEFCRFIVEKHGSLDLYNALKNKVDSGCDPDWLEEIERLQGLLDEYETSDWLPGEGT